MSAVISADGVYRYRLTRSWLGDGPPVTFVMLNPSIADATDDDPTIRKCRGFAERAGASGIVVVNLYAYRATKPPAMWDAAKRGVDIVGPENDEWLARAASDARASGGLVVAAWGANVKRREARNRPYQVLTILRREVPVACLKLTTDGIPGHPLMLGYAEQPHLFLAADA